jgi:integrase
MDRSGKEWQVANIKMKIGLQIIAGMPPGPFLIWDSAVKGFCCRRQFSDAITYSVFFRTRTGLQRWMKIGRHGILTPTEARAEAIRILRAVTLGEDPANERYALRSGATMSELLDDYVADMQSVKLNGKKSSTISSDNSRIKNHIRPRFGKLRVSAITQSTVEEFMNSMSAGSAKRIIILLGSIFTFAINKGLRGDNPCSKIKKPPDVRRTRRLSEVEYAQLHKALSSASNSTAASVITFLAITGWRSGEARNLSWSELNLPRQIANLTDTKSGKSIRPLSLEAIKIIEAQPKSGPYVFAYKDKPLINLHQYFNRLGLSQDVTPHSLRHSYASLAADMGLADSTIARLLGHRQISITSRYIHMEKSVIEASNLVANETMRLMRL